MNDYLSLEQFVEILEHNKGNDHDTDIWVLYEDGSTEIVPDQPIDALQDPHSWPRYICRAAAINAHVGYDTSKAADPNNPLAAVDGLYSALDHINWAIGATITTGTPIREMASSVARAAGRFLKRFSSTSS